MAESMKCPKDNRDCLIDPVELEGRLVRIETKLDQIINGGLSGKAIAGITTLISGLVVGIIEGLRTYFSKGN